jgi:quercetin dioxygenase-like cupin family protein
MPKSEFPEFIKNLPEADVPVKDLDVRLLQGPNRQVVFISTDKKVVVPEHSHGGQWGIIVNGKLDLTIAGKTSTLAAGDSFYIPSGTRHSAVLYPGFREIDVFENVARYRPKQR